MKNIHFLKSIGIFIFVMLGLFLIPSQAYAVYITTGTDSVSPLSVNAGDSNTITISDVLGETFSNGKVIFTLGGISPVAGTDYYQIGNAPSVALNASQINGKIVTISGINGQVTVKLILNNKTYAVNPNGVFGDTYYIAESKNGTDITTNSMYGQWTVCQPTLPGALTVTPSAVRAGSSGNNITLSFALGGTVTVLEATGLLKFTLPAGFVASTSDTIEFVTVAAERNLTAGEITDNGTTVTIGAPRALSYMDGRAVVLRLKNKTAPSSGTLAFIGQADRDGDVAGSRLFSLGTGEETKTMAYSTQTLAGSSIVLYSNYWSKTVATGFVEGTTLSDFAVSYTPGEALPDGTVVFTIPDALKGNQLTGYFGPSSGNNGHEVYDGSITTWGLNSEYSATLIKSGNTVTMKGVKTLAGEVVVLQAWDSIPAPAAGTYSFSVIADADGDGTMATRKPGYPGVTDGSTRYSSTATTKSITSTDKSIYQLSYKGDTSGEYYVAKCDGSITLTVTKTGNTDSTTTVYCQTYDGYQYHNGTDWAISTPGWDFSPTYNTPHLLTFNPGETSKTFTVTINPNWAAGEVHQNKYFIAWLSSPSNSGTLGENSGYVGQTLHPAYIIIATSPLPVLTSAETTTAGDKITLSFDKAMWDPIGTEILFGVKVNGSADNVTTASANIDPTKIDLTLETPVAFGQTVTVSYTRTNYYVRSAWEVGLQPLLSFTDQAVTNNLPSPTPAVGLSAATYSVKESDGNLAVTVNRTVGTTKAFTVDYATSDSTAIAGKNYVESTGTLSFAIGETSKIINIKINDDGLFAKDNTFNLTLSSPVGAALTTVSSAVITITDTTSETPAVGLSAAAYSVKESDGNLAVPVNRTGNTAQEFTVDYATSDSTAIAGKNYVASTGTLSFAAEESSKIINIKINNDGLKVKDNTFNLTLSNPVGASLASDSSAVVTITDTTAGPDPVVPADLPIEPSGTLQFSAATYGGYEGKNVGVTITRMSGSNGVVGVSWSIDESSTAVSDTDFSPDTTNSSPLSFADGETSKTLTFAIPADTDNSVERVGQTIVLTISTPTGNAALGTQTSTTITLSDYIPDSKTSKNKVKTLTALNPTIALNPGDSAEGLLSVTLSNGVVFNLDSGDSEITWKSGNIKIATVSSSGVITAVGFGSTKVTATYGGKTANITVNTALQALSGVDSYGTTIPEAKAGATTPTLNLNLNSTDMILLSATNVNTVQAYVYSGMAWTTSNKKVATVDNNGVINTTGTPGTTTIIGTYGGKKVKAKINTSLTDLTLSYPTSTTSVVIFTPSSSAKKPAELKMKLGDISDPLILTTTLATSALADVAADSLTKWKTSNSKVATVDSTGVVTTTALPGTATITGTYCGKSVKVTVNTNLKDLAVTYPDPTLPTVIFTAGATATKPSDLKMKPGDVSKALVVTNTFANDESVDVAGDSVWKTSNAKIATVEKGVITPSTTKLGTAIITVTYGGKKATIKVNTAITGLTADKTELSLNSSGATDIIVLTANYANGDNETGNVTATSAVWKSSNTKVATVDSNGVVTSVGTGTANITATYGGKTVKIKVIISLT